jgi:hypothetical protein
MQKVKRVRFLNADSSLGGSQFSIPVFTICGNYFNSTGPDKNRISIGRNGKTGTAEKIGSYFFEERGFQTFEGLDVDEFLRVFLVGIGRERYGMYFHKYLLGSVSSERLIKRIRSDAKDYYLAGRKRVESSSRDNARSEISSAIKPRFGASNRRTEEFLSNKKKIIDFMTNDFLKNYVSRSNIKNLSRAYNAMTNGSPPDLFVYNSEKKEWFFVEVKSIEDGLSSKQWDWIGQMQKYNKDRFLLLRISMESYYLKRYFSGY